MPQLSFLAVPHHIPVQSCTQAVFPGGSFDVKLYSYCNIDNNFMPIGTVSELIKIDTTRGLCGCATFSPMKWSCRRPNNAISVSISIPEKNVLLNTKMLANISITVALRNIIY